MLYPFVNFEWNECVPSKVFDWNPKVWHLADADGSYDPYVSTMFPRRHKKDTRFNWVNIYEQDKFHAQLSWPWKDIPGGQDHLKASAFYPPMAFRETISANLWYYPLIALATYEDLDKGSTVLFFIREHR